jgi:hypothetical protein
MRSWAMLLGEKSCGSGCAAAAAVRATETVIAVTAGEDRRGGGGGGALMARGMCLRAPPPDPPLLLDSSVLLLVVGFVSCSVIVEEKVCVVICWIKSVLWAGYFLLYLYSECTRKYVRAYLPTLFLFPAIPTTNIPQTPQQQNIHVSTITSTITISHPFANIHTYPNITHYM